MNEKIFKLAKTEAEWMRYYAHIDSRNDEKFQDINFYDRMLPIGYSKVYTPLSHKCPMAFVNKLDLENVEVIYGPRNHKNNIYTPLEYIIHNKIDGYLELIKIVKE